MPMRLVPRQLARDQRELDVDLPLDCFPRLHDVVVDLEGAVRVRVRFARDEEGRTRLAGTIAARVRIRCGNCLEVDATDLDVEIDSCVVTSEEAARELVSELDPLVLESQEASVADLFEDDLLLALPDRPASHELGCPAQPAWEDEESAPAQRTSPFAVLAGLGRETQDD